jgi:hypothetical protein
MAEGSGANVSSPARLPPSPRLRRTSRGAGLIKNMKHYNMGVNTRLLVTREYSNGRGVRIDGAHPSRAKDGAPFEPQVLLARGDRAVSARCWIL